MTEITETMPEVPEKTIDTPISDTELLLSFLTQEQRDAMTPEQEAQIAGLEDKVKVLKVQTEREDYIKEINDTLMLNAKSIKDGLPKDIPAIANIITLAFSYSQETQTFEPVDAIPRTTYFSEAVILDIEIDLYNALQEDLDSKKSKDIVKNTFDAIGKNRYDNVPNLSMVLVETGKYRKNCVPKLMDCYTKEYVNGLRNNIDIPEKYKTHLTTGSVVFTWNSVALLKSLDPESDSVGGKTRRDYVGIQGRWSITTCAFNKSVAKAKSTGAKRTRSTNMDWLPPDLQAKCKTQKDYLQIVFKDDPKWIEKKSKLTKDANGEVITEVGGWKSLQIPQLLKALEKSLPEPQRYYTNK